MKNKTPILKISISILILLVVLSVLSLFVRGKDKNHPEVSVATNLTHLTLGSVTMQIPPGWVQRDPEPAQNSSSTGMASPDFKDHWGSLCSEVHEASAGMYVSLRKTVSRESMEDYITRFEERDHIDKVLFANKKLIDIKGNKFLYDHRSEVMDMSEIDLKCGGQYQVMGIVGEEDFTLDLYYFEGEEEAGVVFEELIRTIDFKK